MTCTYGGVPCLDPAQELANCRLRGYPTPWAGLANSFTCPQGIDYGRGRVLMFRGDLLSLNLNAFYPLVFSDGTRSVTLKQVLFVRAYCATPGGRGDPTEAYWCELADKRLLCHNPIDKAYNVRSTPGGSYYSATLNAGVAWTWSQMVGDIWTIVGRLGTFPGMPFTPNGTPEGWSFYGSDVFVALGQVLDRLRCALDYNPLTDTFGVVRLGVTDAVETAALNAVDPACVWDSDPIEGTRATVPGAVQIFFPRQRATADTTGASTFYSLLQTDPTAGGPLTGVDAGNVATIYDDLPAIYNSSSTLTNASALASRAAERAADYYRVARQTRLYRAYTGGYGTPGLLPGSQLTATIWRDTGGGLFTEVLRLPESLGGDPFAGFAGDGPAGGSTPDGGDTSVTETGGGGGSSTVLLPAAGSPPCSCPAPVNPGIWQYGIYYLYELLYPYFAISLGGGGGSTPLEVKQIDNTQDTNPCTLIKVHNDNTLGLLKWVDGGDTTGVLSWKGLPLYKAGTGQVGPETVLEIQDDGGSFGLLATISDDAVNGRVVLKYSWPGLIVQNPAGTSFGPEWKLQFLEGGPNVTIAVADDPTNKRTRATITSNVTTQADDVAVGTEPIIDFKAGTGLAVGGTDDPGNGRTIITYSNTAPMPATGQGGHLTHYTGTTTSTLVTVFDVTNNNGLVGGLVIKNTSVGAQLTYTVTTTDLYGDANTTSNNLTGLTKVSFNLLSNFGSGLAFYPFKEIKLEIKDLTSGTHANYDIYLVQAT